MKEIVGPRIVLAGSVSSSRRTLQAILYYKMNLVGVLGLDPQYAGRVSGYTRLDDLAVSAAVPYVEFENINDSAVVHAVRQWNPDLLFVVGLSQLVKSELLSIPRLGCIGFHPTWLPKGRGRAPVAWLVLDANPGAATFFLMDEGMDSGPILAQEPFYVSDDDYAADVVEKIETAIDRALDRWLPNVLNGKLEPAPQPHEQATYNGRRAPRDGLIDWSRPVQEIHALIRAASHPHPGAYTFFRNQKLIIWRSEIEEHMPIRGVIGRILQVDEQNGALVQAGNGLLWLTEVELACDGGSRQRFPEFRVGMKLGYSPQDDIHFLKRHVVKLESRLDELEQMWKRFSKK